MGLREERIERLRESDGYMVRERVCESERERERGRIDVEQ